MHALLGGCGLCKSLCLKIEPRLLWLDFTRATIIYKPDFAIENDTDLPKRRAENLPKPSLKTDLAKNLLCQKKRTWQKKPNPNLPKLLLKKCSRFWKPDFTEKNASQKKTNLAKWNHLLTKTWLKTTKPILATWVNLKRNFRSKKHEPIFEKQKLGKLPPLKKPDFIETETLLKTKTLIRKTQTQIWKITWFCEATERFNEADT